MGLFEISHDILGYAKILSKIFATFRALVNSLPRQLSYPLTSPLELSLPSPTQTSWDPGGVGWLEGSDGLEEGCA